MKLAFLHQSTDQRRDLILHGNIFRTLVLLSVPTLLLSLVQSLMPLSDGLFINNVSGTLVASAVTYCTPIVNMMVALAQGLGVAVTAIVGQINGAGDYRRVKYIAAQSAVFGSLLGVVMIPVLICIAFPASTMVSDDISHNVFLYLSLYSLVLPFSFLQAIFNAIKNATGKPEPAFIGMALMLVFKICFNVIFIVWLRLDIVGCVLASLGANLLISVWMVWELFFKDGEDRLELRGFRFDWGEIKGLVRLGIPSMLANVLLQLGFVLINTETAKYGSIVLNGQGVANNITMVCFLVPAAFGAAVTTMVSMNVGAGQNENAHRSFRYAWAVSAATATAIIAVVVPLSPYITILFTRDAAVLEVANTSLNIYIYSGIFYGICMVQQGAFIGLGRTKIPIFLGLLRIWFLRFLFILATEEYLGVYSVFWGNLFSNATTAAITGLLMTRMKWVSVIRGMDRKPDRTAKTA